MCFLTKFLILDMTILESIIFRGHNPVSNQIFFSFVTKTLRSIYPKKKKKTLRSRRRQSNNGTERQVTKNNNTSKLVFEYLGDGDGDGVAGVPGVPPELRRRHRNPPRTRLWPHRLRSLPSKPSPTVFSHHSLPRM